MRIGILGTGALAAALGRAWSDAGHEIIVGGRDPSRAAAVADRLGGAARPGTLRAAASGGEAVLLAVLWPGVEEALHAAGGQVGVLTGKPLIDPTNAVEHGVGELLTSPERSGAERVAELAVGAQVVKGFHLLPADTWTRTTTSRVTVPLCGDDEAALSTVSRLVADASATPIVLGGLSRARQLEEAAGFVIGLAFGGADPATAVPSLSP